MRSRKLKHVEKVFDWSSPLVEADPAACAGQWAQRYLPGAREVRLDLGCGKGTFAVRSAQAEPDVLFVAMDCERGCVAMAATRAQKAELPNLIFAVGDASDLARYFAPGELALLYLNFSTPFTPAKQAPKRLTHAERLDGYRDLLAPGGAVRFKTDSAPLFDYSLTQFELAGYDLAWSTRDLHAFNPAEVQSDYEEMLSAQGASICSCLAMPGPRPAQMVQTAPQGLASYLPEDLDSMTYIPYGMESTVENFKNKKANQQRRERAAARRARKTAGGADGTGQA